MKIFIDDQNIQTYDYTFSDRIENTSDIKLGISEIEYDGGLV